MTAARRRRFRPLVPVIVGGLALSGAVSGASPSSEGFAAVASAQGGRFTFSVPGFAVVEDVIDGGGPVSQAAVDAGGAVSFASLPYPGESAIAFPGLFNAVTGQPFPGAYPFYVTASHPTQPTQEVADPAGAYRLRTTAADGTASGLAQLAGGAGPGTQGGSGGTQTLASVGRDGDAVVAKAETRNEALQFGGGTLRIASVRSLSSTTYRPGQPKPVTRTELVVDGGSAGGYRFGYGPSGLVVASQGVPIPAGQGLAQLNHVLEPAGVSLRFVAGERTPAGATADALEIKLAGQAPVPGTPPGVVRLRLGGASSSVSVGQSLGLGDIGGAGGDFGSAVPEPATPPVATDPGASTGGGTTSATPAVPGGLTIAPPGSPADPRSNADDAALPLTVSGSEPRDGQPTASGQPAETAAPVVQIVQPRRLRSDGFLYGVLLAAAIALLVVAGLWRSKGVSAK